jgi:hypothetical protein
MTNVTGTASGLTSGKVTVTDSTANTNFPVIFHDESNALLDDTSALTYNPSSGTLVVPNLNVSGTTTTVDTTNLVVSDKLIELSNGATGTPAAEADSGLIIERGDSTNVFIGWDEGSDRVRFATTSSTGSSSTVSFVSNADIQAGRLYGNVTGDVTGNADTSTKIASITNSDIVQLTSSQTLSNKTLASPAFTGDINFTDASTPQFTVTDTTNTVSAQLRANDTTGTVGTTTDNNFSIIRNGTGQLNFVGAYTMHNNGGNDIDFRAKDSSGNVVFKVDAGDSKTHITTLKLDSVSISAIQTGSESFADNDTSLMTSAAIQDKINEDALLDSEVDADIKTLLLPANTTISAFAKTYLDDADTTTFQNTIFGTTDVALGGQAKPRVVTLDYKTDSLTAIGSGDNFIIIDASDNYNLKVANFPTIIGTTGTINANEFARFTNSTTLQALTAAETVTALGLDDVPTVSSGSNDRIATFTGTSALQGESNLTFNSSNVLYVNGSVGIGATSPSASLEISKAGGEYLDLDISGISSGTSKLRFLDGGTAKFELRHFAGSALLNANLSVYDHNTSSEALTIQAGGNVGVGTNSPKTKLDIENTTAPTLSNDTHAGEAIFLRSGGSAGDGNVQAVLAFGKADGSSRRSGSAIASVQTDSDADKVGIGFYTSSSSASSQTMGQRMLLDHTGNVGIGTTSPAVDLHILDTGGHSQLRIETDNASSGAYLELESTTNKYQIYNVGGDLGIDESGVATRFIIKDSTGNVGIGTNSPSAKLDIDSTSGTALYVDGGVAGANIAEFHRTDGATASVKISGLYGDPIIHFADTDRTFSMGIDASENHFKIAEHTDLGANERFRIADSGDVIMFNNVGIGTTSPQSELNIKSDTNSITQETLSLSPSTTNSSQGGLGVQSGGLISLIGNNVIAFRTGGGTGDTEAMRIDSSQRVGIGTASPNHNLQIEGGGSESILNLTTTGNSNGLDIIVGTDGHAAIWLRENDYMHFATNNTERMRIDSSGNVGIGTTSPSVKLQVADTSTHCFIRVKGGTGSYAGIDFGDDDDDDISRIRHNNSDNSLGFYTSNAEKMRIDSSGNIGIGTTSPAEKLHIIGQSFINGQLYGGFGGRTTGGTADWNHSTNARSGNGHTLLLSTATNGPGTTAVNTGNTAYYHTLNFEYASYDGDSNMTQIGIPYYFANLDGVRPVIRSRYSGTWSQWHSIPIANQNGSIQGSKGSASNPSYVFNQGSEISEPDTGMFCPGANMIGFSTGGTEKMRISAAGNVLIGGTSASGHGFNLEVLNDHAYVKGPDGWNGTGDKAIVALGSGVSNESFGCGYVYGTGLVLSTYKLSGGGHFGSSTQNSLIIADTTGQASFINDVIAFASSDKRLKENIKPLDNALDKINKINGVEFDWIDGKDEHGNSVHSNTGHDVGVIAQEIEEVLPEVVTTRDNGYKAIKYEKIVPLLIEAIKEQQQQINKLEEKLNG